MTRPSDISDAQHRVLEMLLDAIRLLAADVEDQQRFFPEWIDVCSEMACYLGDAIDLLRSNGGLIALSNLQVEQIGALRTRMQQAFGDQSKPQHGIQSPTSAFWNSIRQQARELLLANNWQAPPAGGFVSFIPG